MNEALKLALEALEDAAYEWSGYVEVDTAPRTLLEHLAPRITAIKESLTQSEQDSRRLQIAMRQWEDWKAYALELQKKLVKYEGGSPMILNTQPQEKNT